MVLLRGPVAAGAEFGVEPTPARRIRQANAERWSGQGQAPGVDPGQLSLRYGGDAAYRPRARKATFKVPLGISAAAFQKEQARLVRKWINRQLSDGWDWCSEYGIRVYPGHYPAYDYGDRGIALALLDQREFIAQAVFKQRAPQLIRTEIPPDLLQGIDVRWAGASPR